MKTQLSFTLLALACFFTFSSCSHKVIYKSMIKMPSSDKEVKIIIAPEEEPTAMVKIGTIKLKDGGLAISSKCDYEQGIEILKKKAKQMGADVVYISLISPPAFFVSACYTFFATFYCEKDKVTSTL